MSKIASFPLLILLAACVAPQAPPPANATRDAGAPYIRGTVTNVTERGVMVEENPSEQSGSAKAMLRIDGSTAIVSSDGRALSRADLRAGLTVSAWTTGQVMESYPVQATASRIVVHAAR